MAILSCETFCKTINFIKSESEKWDEVDKAFTEVCPDGSNSLSFVPCRYESKIVTVLKECMHDNEDIEYYLYEDHAPEYTVGFNGKDYTISDAASLYEFLLETIPGNRKDNAEDNTKDKIPVPVIVELETEIAHIISRKKELEDTFLKPVSLRKLSDTELYLIEREFDTMTEYQKILSARLALEKNKIKK